MTHTGLASKFPWAPSLGSRPPLCPFRVPHFHQLLKSEFESVGSVVFPEIRAGDRRGLAVRVGSSGAMRGKGWDGIGGVFTLPVLEGPQSKLQSIKMCTPVKTSSCQDPTAPVLHKPPASSLNTASHPWKDSPQDRALGEAAALVAQGYRISVLQV